MTSATLFLVITSIWLTILLLAWVDSIAYREHVQSKEDPALLRKAEGYVRRDSIRVASLACWVSVGIVSVLQVSAPVFILVVFFLGLGLQVLPTWLEYRDRHS